MDFIHYLFLGLGILAGLFGLGFAAQWVSYMIRGVNMSYETGIFMTLVAATGFTLAIWLIPYYGGLVVQ